MKMQWFTRVVNFGFSLCWLIASPSSQPVKAAGIYVNTAEDVVSTNGICSLREAINNANSDSDTTMGDCAAGSGADSITFAGDYIITLDGIQLPSITSEMIITGNGREKSIIQAHTNRDMANWRVFNVTSSGKLTLNDLTVQHGKVDIGGGIYIGLNATMIIHNTSISKNSAVLGGGIYNLGNLSITHSTISENSTIDITNGRGGGIHTMNVTLSITDSTLSGNTSVLGGGIFRNETITSIINSNITENSTGIDGFDGGGIYSYSITFSNFEISNCLINNNFSESEGGGIFLSPFSRMTITNSTISGNISNLIGGGIINQGTLDLINVTINDNVAELGGGSVTILEF